MVSPFFDVNRHPFENMVQRHTPIFVAAYRHLQVEPIALLGYRR